MLDWNRNAQEARAEPAQDGVALGGGDQDLLLGDVGHGADDRQRAVEPRHADLAIDDGDAVLAGRLAPA